MEAADINPISVEATTTSRRRRKKSIVWDHFTVETLAGGSTRACCKLCKQTFAYSTGAKLSGTSHLKRHILLGSCPMIRLQQKQLAANSNAEGNENPVMPQKRRYRSSSNLPDAFDQEESCSHLANMIIMHEYKLHMVEHSAFVAFVQGLQPQFRMPNANSVESDIIGIYNKEKQNLYLLLGNVPGRVSLTICLWSTSHSLGYVSLTGHFIDNDWKLHRRMLNFTMVSSPHSENALSETIEHSLSYWNMKSKLFTITLDSNCSSHDIYSANLRDHLSNKNNLMLKGQLFVVRCYAHILNVVAQDVIASIHGIVYNIRESIKYVKASIANEEIFVGIVQQFQISGTETLSLDVQTHWNTTYLMLVGALQYKHAFACLESCDPDYNESPSADDWKKVEIVCAYLKLLFDSSNVIREAACPTSNVYFPEASKIQLELKKAESSEDEMVRSITEEMHEKFDKYWRDVSLVLAIGVIMDPRFKMKLVEFCYNKIYGGDAARYIKVANDGIHELYLEYIAAPMPLTPAYVPVPHQEEANNDGTIITEANIIEDKNACMNSDRQNIFEADKVKIENVNADNNNTLENVHSEDVELENAKMSGTDSVNMETVGIELGTDDMDYHMSIVDNYDIAVGNADCECEDNKNNGNQTGTAFPTRDGLLDFDIYISEMSATQQTKSELDQYLEEALVPRIHDFDILHWWRLNTLKYPTLSKMARDVLTIPMSMATSDTIFSSGTGSRILDDYRSSLRPETVEALFCAKDWLQYAPAVSEQPSVTEC